MTLDELNELRDKNDGKLASGKHLHLSDGQSDKDDYEPTIKKKRTINRKTIVQVSDRFKGVDSSLIKKESELFENKEFCVIGDGNQIYNKKQLETKIYEHGGVVVQNPCEESTFCVIAHKMISKCEPYKAKDKFDIVKIDWSINCIKEKRFLQFKPSDFLYCTKKTEEYLNQIYDCYGDSYTEDLTLDSIKELFANLDTNSKYLDNFNLKNNIREEIAEIEYEYFANDFLQFRIFRLDNIYLDIFETLDVANNEKIRVKNTCLDFIELKIKWHGGLVTNCLDEKTTHCVVDQKYFILLYI